MEVAAVTGLAVTASVASITRNNVVSSGIDLADLSKCGPSWKYLILYRPGMKKGVRRTFSMIVTFSRFDRLKGA